MAALGSNSAEPLNFLEETLDQLPLLVQVPVYQSGIKHIALGRNYIMSPMLGDISPNGSSTISLICQAHCSHRVQPFPVVPQHEHNRYRSRLRGGTLPGFPSRLRQRESWCSTCLWYARLLYSQFFPLFWCFRVP